MMRNKKNIRLLTCLCAATLLTGVAGTVAACAPPIIDDPPYTVEKPQEDLPAYDADIKMDGVLNDAAYAQLRWLENEYVTNNVTVTVRMSAYFGEKGVFLLFDVDDPAVFINPDRNPSWNSGIELYLAEAGVDHIEGEGWEIDFTPGIDMVSTRLQRNGGFVAMLTAKEDTPFMRSVGKGGAVGAEGTEGYTMEAFFPYGFFGIDEGGLDALALNPVLLRAYDLVDNEYSQRVWHNFGLECKKGYSFSNPTTWWQFKEGGLDAWLVTLQTDGNGTLDGNSFVVNGESLELTVTPDTDYSIKSVKCGGTDYTDKLFIEDGAMKVVIDNVAQDITVEAEFERFPTERYALTGDIEYFGAPLPDARFSELTLQACCRGAFFDADFQNGGGYSVDLPAGEYILILTKEDGTVVAQQTGSLSAAATCDISIEKTLDADILEGKEDFTKNFSDATAAQQQGILYDNKDNGETYPSQVTFESAFYAPSIGSIMTDNIKFGMRIYLKNAGGGGDFSVADVVLGKKADGWYLGIGYDLIANDVGTYKLSEEQVTAVQEGTFKVLVIKEGVEHRLYALNGDDYEYVAGYTDDDDTLVSFATIDLITHKDTAGSGVGAFGMKGTTVYTNYADGIDASDISLIKALVNGTVRVKPVVEAEHAQVVDMSEDYSVGATLTFKVQLDRFAELQSVSVNGTPLTAVGDTYSYVIRAEDILNGITITVDATADAIVYAGTDATKAFSEVEDDTIQGTVYNYATHASAKLQEFTVVESKFQAPSLSSVTENGVRFGLRFYSKQTDDLSNTGYIDVVIANENNQWYLDIGADLVNDKLKPETKYALSSQQFAAVCADGLRVLIVQADNVYRLYAEDDGGFDFVEAFTDAPADKPVRTAFATIDLVTNPATAASRGKGDFGVKGTTVYGGFDETLTDTALIRLLTEDADAQVRYPVVTDAPNVTVGGLSASYQAGDTLTFTVTPDRFATVTKVTVNGVEVTESAGSYSYPLPDDITGITVQVQSTVDAIVYAGKGDIVKNFKTLRDAAQITSESSSGSVVAGQGTLYTYSDHSNMLPTTSVIVSNFYASALPDEQNAPSGCRFGMRIYTCPNPNNDNGNQGFIDVIVARQNNKWVLDIGNAVAQNSVTPATGYPLSDEQFNALKTDAGLQIAIVQTSLADGVQFALYAEDNGAFELVETFSVQEGNRTTYKSIDLVVNGAAAAMMRSGDGDFGVKGTTVYGGFDETLTDTALIRLLTEDADAQVRYPVVTDAPNVTVGGLSASYQAGDTLTFTVTPDRFATVTKVTVNGVEVTESAGSYSYPLPDDITGITVQVQSTVDAIVYAGKGDIVNNFSDSDMLVSNALATDNLYHSNGNYLSPMSVIESNFYMPEIASVSAENVAFGMRVYLTNTAGGGAFTCADVVIGRKSDGWYMGTGYDMRGANKISAAYKLSDAQLTAAASGNGLKILLVKDGVEHRLYAQDGNAFELVGVYTDDDATMTSYKSIDLLVHNRQGTDPHFMRIVSEGNFGMKGTTVYGNFAATYTTDAQLIELITGKQIAGAAD